MLTVLEFSSANSVGWTPAVFLYMRRIDGLDIATDHVNSDMALDMLMKNTKTRLQFTDCDTNE